MFKSNFDQGMLSLIVLHSLSHCFLWWWLWCVGNMFKFCM